MSKYNWKKHRRVRIPNGFGSTNTRIRRFGEWNDGELNDNITITHTGTGRYTINVQHQSEESPTFTVMSPRTYEVSYTDVSGSNVSHVVGAGD